MKARKIIKTPNVMAWVLVALLPGLAGMTFYFGLGVLWNLFWLSALCLATEVLVVALRTGSLSPALLRAPLQNNLGDGTTLLAAWLIAICLPPYVSIQILAVAALASIGLAKHAYGGLGNNIFNPAMVGYAVILLSFPQALAAWPALGGAENLASDALSGATYLSEFRYRDAMTVDEFLLNNPQVMHQQIIAGLFLLGGLGLIYLRIISWRIPLALLITVGLLASVTYDQGSTQSMGSAWFHWATGGTMAAAFFVATDPVTHPSRHSHQIIFAVSIGILLFVIRTQGNLPDGIAFAVLLANCATPLLNRIHRQREKQHV
ncbi:MAG: RnfABCDGE type electron transport complex subunit D [Gammaproteobacteria bacterium]|jgi:electron transport complex protein RnfD|nr:RnfABCDGE type electron transport complex subunit D [Gammaproteobacteria bacterium]MBT3695243.1 RnfABCDGE type electron transport complex subunit D [Gammaproteobacteria bacterium]MBT5333681.1 RnfABCDGE type electron transport complex subunit D [Gammaproteobacteria bacterium]MBT5682146.1 RnfABCDGE type electron transport complex subunit D [Gammaproteobacteria bacterium]MBT6558570.1 RnfABCDGE type electron transport complex subunit D [Gammaproteobacteria bacterium]